MGSDAVAMPESVLLRLLDRLPPFQPVWNKDIADKWFAAAETLMKLYAESHKPAPAKDADPKVRILPPIEIADHAEAMGWTPESWVWKCNRYGSIRVYPSSMVLESGKVFRTDLYETESVRHGDTLLPNRRVPVEAQASHHDASPPAKPHGDAGTWAKAATAGEVAEGCVRLYEQHRPAIDGRAFLVEIITSAIERARERKP